MKHSHSPVATATPSRIALFLPNQPFGQVLHVHDLQPIAGRLCNFVHDRAGAILAAIIDRDNLKVRIVLRKQRLQAGTNVSLFLFRRRTSTESLGAAPSNGG